METQYLVNNESTLVQVGREGHSYRVQIGERHYQVQAHPGPDGRFVLDIDGRRVVSHVVVDGVRRHVFLNGHTYLLAPPERRHRSRAAGSGEDTLNATMPGQVIAVRVTPGESVERGQTLVILEAMKMELRVAAPHNGTVRTIHVSPGQTVERGQLLLELSADTPA